MRDFYDHQGRVNTKNKWVWVVHAISYTYVLYVYIFTDARNVSVSETSKMWIPLDIILTIFICMYQVFYFYQ